MSERETAKQALDEVLLQAEMPPALPHADRLWRLHAWAQEEGPWWLCSFVFHLVLVCSLALMGGKVVEQVVDEAPSFDEAKLDHPANVPQQIERFEIGEAPEDPTELSTDSLAMEKPAQIAQEEKYYDESPTFKEGGGGGVATVANQPSLGGLGGFDVKSLTAGPAVKGKGGVGVGIHPGSGGEGWGFGGRGAGSRKAMLASGGGTRQSERAVAGALNWIARHQSLDGSWSLMAYKARCKDPSCTSEAKSGDRPAAATAMALLPFLAAGQTHETKGRYKQSVHAGIIYLIKNQKPDGDLRMGGQMYDHGLAAIALCECYGMSGDKLVGRAAQAALNFIAEAQDPVGGGWRYGPRDPGDTSVVGWQLMALKSGQMAYLTVNPVVFERAKQFLKSAASGTQGSMGIGGLFGYVPKAPATPTMTSVGLLCSQYLGAMRTDPAMMEGTAMLMQHQPGAEADPRNLYYWYYATQVMHNQPGPDWDTWNRKMRHLLIDTQCKEGNCAAGSWDPKMPQPDTWGEQGGRLYMTGLSALTLEVYYRYLPLYKLDKDGSGGIAPAGAATKPAASKPADKPAAKPADKPAEHP